MPLTATGLAGAQQALAQLTPAGQTPLGRGTTLRQGLLAYWTFDAGSGSFVADAVGTNLGTWVGTLGSQWGAGIINGGGKGNGTNNSVNVGAALADLASATYACWLQVTSFPATNGRIFDKANAAGQNGITFIVTGAAGTISCSRFGGYTTAPTSLSFTALTLNTWAHVAATFDGTRKIFRLYMNGAEVSYNGQTLGIGTPASDAANSLGLLGGIQNTTRSLAALMDEAGVWARALTAAEIAQLYNGGAGLRPV
jgi:hypothetical protein